VRLLLDTHIWLWALLDPDRLSRGVARAVADPENELWLSPVSVWEAILLCERGRLEVDRAPVSWVRDALAELPVRDAPLSREVALASSEVELAHADPADHFLAATALVYDLTLVTADRRLLRPVGGAAYRVMANARR
jgi:PIN domain nuclease of toxin-antitoxin system